MKILIAMTVILLCISPTSPAGTVAWFYALDSEKAAFESVAGEALRTVTSGDVTMHDYRVGPHRVVAAKMGSGCVKTASTVSTVLALNPADRVISTGPAGGLGDEAEPGTWLRVEEVVAWQKGRAGESGRVSAGDASRIKLDFAKEDWPEGEWREMKAVTVASGEAFIASGSVRREIAGDTSATAVEMNAFGLMTALEGRNVKVLLLRIVSDRADERASDDFAEFSRNHDGKGGKLAAQLVKELPVEPNEPTAHEELKKLLEE